ncbi:MAG: hypothetical protein ISN26_00010 [Betaproteobacteria bacterium AqS2]|uniref:DUF3987 domain-containing protein n=1 Tax=Candidatus Amphirhobacter heronislandensis TaxID=1732024 RepID=A0A930UFW1_9GAMM|nr:hypothetical protein [Betaproteobacteria bacterium AqS2]
MIAMPAEPQAIQKIVSDTLSPVMFGAIWTNNYHRVFPVAMQDFDLSTMLPAIFYLFRYGERRGTGRFFKSFPLDANAAGQGVGKTTIDRVGEVLSQKDDFKSFGEETEKAILGDMLLSSCLGNKLRESGHDKKVQRVYPTHYLSSWIDIPDKPANLRNVPEMMVSILADDQGEFVKTGRLDSEEDKPENPFPVGFGYENNLLIRAFNQGVIRRENAPIDDRASDRFDENESSIGLEQLMMIRLAQTIGKAPDPSRDKEGVRSTVHRVSGAKIPNQRPIAEKTSQEFSEDIRLFLRAYSSSLPRYCLIEMLESCMAIGLVSMLTAATKTISYWAEEGRIHKKADQNPADFFVDCSLGVDRNIRDMAERSMDEQLRRMRDFPVILMALRVLDFQASKDTDLPARPYSTRWLNFLGDMLYQRTEEAKKIHGRVEEKVEILSRELIKNYPQENEYAEAKSLLSGESPKTMNHANAIFRLARGLTSLMGTSYTYGKFTSMMDSCFHINRPNGIAAKRKRTRDGKRGEARSMILSDSALGYLVHLHALPKGKESKRSEISLRDFIDLIRKRYGFYIDRSPPGMDISKTLLQRNRSTLERRLRDLGLLIGVNDAESMKRLRPRFERAAEIR